MLSARVVDLLCLMMDVGICSGIQSKKPTASARILLVRAVDMYEDDLHDTWKSYGAKRV